VNAQPLCLRTQAMLAIGDLTDRTPKILGDGEQYSTARIAQAMWDREHPLDSHPQFSTPVRRPPDSIRAA